MDNHLNPLTLLFLIQVCLGHGNAPFVGNCWDSVEKIIFSACVHTFRAHAHAPCLDDQNLPKDPIVMLRRYLYSNCHHSIQTRSQILTHDNDMQFRWVKERHGSL